jgi:hypothetical protein
MVIDRPALDARRLGRILSGLILAACAPYSTGADVPVFLSGRLVGPGGDPATRCDAGVELAGAVEEWRPVDSEFREMFLLPAGPRTHRVAIQCRGYLEHVVVITAAGARWRVGGEEFRTNQTVPLGVIVLQPGDFAPG